MSVLKIVEGWTLAHPEKLLFSFLDQTGSEIERHTYASFLARVDVIASHLAARPELPPRSRVMLAFPPGLDMICALFACARADMIAVPVVPPTGHGAKAALLRIAHVAQDSGAAVLVTTRDGRDLLHAEIARGSEDVKGGLAGLVLLAAEEMAEPAGRVPRAPHGDIFFLQYTSGSTSQPKGVMVSHANLIANRSLVVDHDTPVCVTWLPQHHDMGLIGYYIYSAMSGGQTYGFSPATFIQRPALWLDTISRRGATASSAPNFAFDYCLRPGRLPEETFQRLDLSSLRFLMAAAEPIRADTFRSFLHKFQGKGLKPESFFVAYGLAENTLAVSNYGRTPLSVSRRALSKGQVRITRDASGITSSIHLMSCGKALGDNEVRIVDPETLRPLDDGQVGEIWVAGASKCLGYWQKPELTREMFEARLAGDAASPLSFLRTQDMGFIHDGELFVCGRLKDMIIVRGQNIYPQDIEAVVEGASPLVRKGCVAAFSLGEESSGHIAVVAELSGTRGVPDAGVIAAAVRNALAVDLGSIVFVAPKSVPKTSSGKIMRFQTRELLREGKLQVIDRLDRMDGEAGAEAEAGTGDPFEMLRTRYRLKGDEPVTLMDAGVDSFDLVVLMHEVKEMLGERSEGVLGDYVDISLMQQVTVADLFKLKAQFDAAPDDVVVEVSHFVARMRASYVAEEKALMEADRRLAFTPARPAAPAPDTPPRAVLLTGGTGFLGPFLLSSLLDQSTADIHVLVRGDTPEAARARLVEQAEKSGVATAATMAAFERRVKVVCGTLDRPAFGLSADAWRTLADEVDAIYHNGATVNYLFTYKHMRDTNIGGTSEALRLAFEGRPKQFNHVSTTFIFGWATKDFLHETDNNDGMELLDFGYSQSKWVSEQVVLDARRHGLPARIFRPALITPSVNGGGATFDITIRLLAFMIKHGIGVKAQNQVSFMPADVTATNIVAIAQSPNTLGGTFHVTRDDYANMTDVTDIISARTGYGFELFSLPDFVPEVIRRCTKSDLIYPLLDFLIGSIDSISSMEFKRYDSTAYQTARDASLRGMPDPSLDDTVGAILTFLERHRVI